MRIKKFLESVWRRYKATLPALNRITISQWSFFHNINTLGSRWTFFPVIKSNAYWHWLKQVSTILKWKWLEYICVDSYPEYQIVRDYAKTKVLVLGETLPELYKQYWSDATLCVWSMSLIKVLLAHNRSYTLHLFINTWMNREWATVDEIPEIISLLQWSKIRVEWVLSHFANADEQDDSFSYEQMKVFEKAVTICKQTRPDIRYIHHNNSAWWARYDSSSYGCNASRVWLWLYGYSPVPKWALWDEMFADLQKPLRLYSTVTSVQCIAEWSWVSYGMRFNAPWEWVVASISFWYTEGLMRCMSGKWLRCWNETRWVYLEQAWTICMNLSLRFDATWTTQRWDSIELIWEHCSLNEWANAASTLPYEILVWLSPTCRRSIIS